MHLQQRKRQDRCIAHSDYNFDNVIFTDVSRLQLYRCTRNMWAKYGQCQKMVPHFFIGTVREGISKLGLSPLVLVNGGISSVKYC